jgi:hypothetical protein
MDSDYLLLSSKPSYAIKEFINFNVKTNFKNVILLNYKLRQYIKGNHMYTYKIIVKKRSFQMCAHADVLNQENYSYIITINIEKILFCPFSLGHCVVCHELRQYI